MFDTSDRDGVTWYRIERRERVAVPGLDVTVPTPWEYVTDTDSRVLADDLIARFNNSGALGEYRARRVHGRA